MSFLKCKNTMFMKIDIGGVGLILKQRFESKELKMFRALNSRMSLLEKDRNYYLNLEKGFVGELGFDLLVEALPTENYLVIHDFIYEISNTVFQIDTIILSGNTIYIFEVKNFEGDFYIEKDAWYSGTSDNEVKNPLLQTQRCETLFRRLLKELGFVGTIKSYLIFINLEFHLYHAPRNSQMIFPTQLSRFLNGFRNNPTSITKQDQNISKKLLSIYLTESPYSRIPKYTYDQLKKGIYCPKCYSFFQRSLHCSNCGYKEDLPTAVDRQVREYNLLFPEEKITTNVIYDWCGGLRPERTIRAVLLKSFKVNGYGKSRFYTIE
ncbi:NERD domain-containing protein [Cytobacillus suaedae]|nr:NERD domain-containing protein [Cytobacillus suaedae]